ncbi:MAG TPA: hypothetical protein VF040_14550 [Ktedonobacterales bacterium]
MTTAIPEVPTSPAIRQRIGRVVLVVGNLLMVATFFMPWLELETSFCASGPRCRYHYGPLYLIFPGVPGNPLLSTVDPFLLIVPCALIILACSMALLRSRAREAPGCSMGGLFALCFVCALITLLMMTQLYVGFAFAYPYFHTVVAYGSWLALGSFASILVGAVIIWPG